MNETFTALAYFFCGLVAIWVLVSLGQRYRSMKLAGLAGELGMRLFVKDPLGIPRRYGQVQLFKHGHAQRARNVMIGHYEGRQVRLFDYLYETGQGGNRRTQQFSVVMVGLAGDFPALLARPTGGSGPRDNLTGLEEVTSAVGVGQQGYTVFCQQAEFAREQVGEEILRDLQQCRKAVLELQEGILVVYTSGKVKAAGYRQLQQLAGKLAEHFNPHVEHK